MTDTSLAFESWYSAHAPALFTGANSVHTASALRAAAAVDAANADETAPSGSALPPLALAGASVAGAGAGAAQQLADTVSRCLASGGATGSDYLAAFAAAPATALIMMTNLARQRAAFAPAAAPPSGAQFNRYTTALGQNPLLSLQSSGSQTAADANFSTSDAMLASITSFLGGLPGNVATALVGVATTLGQSKAKTSAGLAVFLFGLQISGSDGRSGITLSMSGSTWQLVYAPPAKKAHDKAIYSANNTGVVVASFVFNTALWTPDIVARVGAGVTSIPSFTDWVAQNSTGS